MVNNMIPKFRLNNGTEVPAVGWGTFLIKNGEEAVRCLCDAVSAGYHSIDTAMIYLNEEGLGKGIRACGLERKDIYLTTKLWNDSHGYEQTLKAFSSSIRRLGLDYIDEYLIHWPGLEQSYIPTWKAFEKLYFEGMIRAIGVCNFTKPALKNLLENCQIRPMINQIEIHPLFQPNDLIQYCRQEDILVEAWRPIMLGKLDVAPIMSCAETHGKTPAQITLRWHYQKGIRAIPKTANRLRMFENIDLFDFTLDAEEMKRIDSLNSYVRTGEAPDEFFETGTFF